MRHRCKTKKLSRSSSYYEATIKSLARAVILHQRIVTTKVRAQLARRPVDQLIALGKEVNSLAARRRAFSFLNDHALVSRLFTEIAPMFSEKNGGYTRIIPFRRRSGDNAELVVLELSVQKPVLRPVKEKEAVEKREVKRTTVPTQEIKPEPKVEHKDIVPPEKEKHKKEVKKPTKTHLGGFSKFFKQKKDSP